MVGDALAGGEGVVRDCVDGDVLAVAVSGAAPDGDEDVCRDEEEE
jgi:hypothetical protein